MPKKPTRFRDPVHAPNPAAAVYYRPYQAQGDPTPLREQAEHLAGALAWGDPLADAWIEASQHLDRSEARRVMQQAMVSGFASVKHPPPALQAWFEQLERVPLWVDPHYLDLGCRAFRRTAPVGGVVLSGFSLMGGYRSSAVAKTLMRTGKLHTAAVQRLIETGRFVAAVTVPGDLAIGREGYRAAIHTRMIHAIIRREVGRAVDWDAGQWGLPINQADMLGTNLLFSVGFLMGSRGLGFRFSEEEAHGVIHLWRYIGYLLGVEPSLLPATEREAARLLYMVGASQPPADADSQQLARALRDVPLQFARTQRQLRLANLQVQLRTGLTRLLLGDEAVDQLGLARHPLQHAARMLPPIIGGIDRLRRITPFGDVIAYRIGDAWIRTGMRQIDRGTAAARQPAGTASVSSSISS